MVKDPQTPEGPSASPSAFGLKKPMARVTRVTLFQREIRERLSDAALDVLLKQAEVISEGQVVPLSKYYGSTMLTLDLSGLKSYFREMMDSPTAVRVAQMLRQDRRVIPRLKALARMEAERVAQARLSNLEMEMKVDAQKIRVLVDLDVEATVASASRQTDSDKTDSDKTDSDRTASRRTDSNRTNTRSTPAGVPS